MTSCIPDQIVESSTFLATSKSIGFLLQSFAAQSVEEGLYFFVMDRGEKKLLHGTVVEQGAGSFILLSGRASHLAITSAEYKLLRRSNTLTSATPLLVPESDKVPLGNSGTLTRLQSTLSKLADEA